jgi:hypothetical protein
MCSLPRTAVFAAVLLASAAAVAQQGIPPAAGGASAASGPRIGPRHGMGPSVGRDFTPGWAMMTPAERDAHRQQMLNATTVDECRRIRDEHLKLMAERARGRGMANMPIGRRDACATLAP